ncbi:hypothetical protein ACS3SW_02110 [Roseobacteraceae bacterium S113]
MKNESPFPMDLWKAARPLSQAWLTYASPDQRVEWKKAQSVSMIEAFTSSLQKADGEPSQKLMAATERMAEIATQRNAISNALKNQTLEWIRGRKLYALGFDTDRTLETLPVELPNSVWDGVLEWEKSRVAFQGLTFREVGLITSKMRADILNVGNSLKSEKTVGRPSIAQDVQDAFATLVSEGKVDLQKTIKWHCHLVRSKLHETDPARFPVGTLKSDEGIRKHLSPLFKALKEDKKQ